MITANGTKVLDYASFTQDVEGQIIRGKLRLGPHEERVKSLLPTIEAAMRAQNIGYEHCALNSIATGQASVVNVDGQLYRMGISEAPKWEDNPRQGPPFLFTDSQWGGNLAGRTDFSGAIDLVEGLAPAKLTRAIELFAIAVRTRT